MHVHFSVPHPFLGPQKLRERTQVEKLRGHWNSKRRSVRVDLVGMSFKECLGSKLNEDKGILEVVKFSLW